MNKPDTGSRRSVGDTSSLEGYQAFTEGRVRLGRSTPRSFLRRSPTSSAPCRWIRICKARTSASRTRVPGGTRCRAPEINQRASSWRANFIYAGRRAIELERDRGGARHPGLSADERATRRRGVDRGAPRRRAGARGTGYQFRLAHAAWGDERLQALARAVDLHPDFPFIHFEAAMVHIARGDLDRASWCCGRHDRPGRSGAPEAATGKRAALAARPRSPRARRRR